MVPERPSVSTRYTLIYKSYTSNSNSVDIFGECTWLEGMGEREGLCVKVREAEPKGCVCRNTGRTNRCEHVPVLSFKRNMNYIDTVTCRNIFIYLEI